MTREPRDEVMVALGRGDEVAAREALSAAVLGLLKKFEALALEMNQSQVRTAEQRNEAVGRADEEAGAACGGQRPSAYDMA